MYGNIFILLTLSTLAFSETNPFDAPVNNGGTTNQSASQMADGVVSKTVMSADAVKENPETESRGREYKADDADKTGQAGTGAAIATGSALMAAAIPMLASPLPPVQAAGAILMSKAAMEFAQAGADSAASSKNKAQNQLLTNNGGNQTGQQSAADKIKAAMKNMDLDKLLGERGINSDDFKDRLANGEFQDPDSVRAALGDTNSYSAEDLEAANGLADSSMNDIFAEVHGEELGKMASNSVGIDEKLNMGSPESESFASSIGLPGSPNLKSGDELPMHNASAIDGKIANTSKGGATSGDSGTKLSNEGFDAKSILAKLVGNEAATALGGKVPGIIKSALEKAGILVPSSKLTIFQTAHRNFRSFGKWRRTYRVAMDTSSLR